MQKKIIALAIAAAFAAPVAMAADGVSLYGSVDAGVASRTAASNTTVLMESAIYNSNRWGINASEDLGDGMKAMANLEGGFNTNDTSGATNTFERGTSVGLSSGDHTVTLGGSQYAPDFKVRAKYDPMGYKFLGVTESQKRGASANGRYNNDIDYTGKFGDVTLMVSKALGTTGYDSDSTTQVGATYVSGPIAAGGVYSSTKVAANTDATIFTSIGGAFNFGDGSVKLGLSQNKTGATVALTRKEVAAGVDFNVTKAMNVGFGYYKTDNDTSGTVTATDTRMILAGVYSLSKKTKLYAEMDKKTTNAGTTGAADVDSNGYALGLSTTF